jgi:hypothetical protein
LAIGMVSFSDEFPNNLDKKPIKFHLPKLSFPLG